MKVKFNDFVKFLAQYEDGMFKTRRLGEAFLQVFSTWDRNFEKVDADLFLEQDFITAKHKIISKYVDMTS